MDIKPLFRKLGIGVRIFLTFLFALLVFGVVLWAYIAHVNILSSQYGIMAFGFYGLLLCLHLLVQSIFAYVEHRRMRTRRDACSYTKTVGFTISAYQEDPKYLQDCLQSVKALLYPPELLRIVMVVDGNTEEDHYMMEMFQEIFADQDPGCYVWQNNYHTHPAGVDPLQDPQRREVEEIIRTKRCVCIMQKWGGKREVMYTAFKALGSSVDYIQVCDSDTKLDPLATVELVKVLESNTKYGAVGGDVMILNLKDSYISFMSSLRYWMAFNVERACQSFFDCVSCISGPMNKSSWGTSGRRKVVGNYIPLFPLSIWAAILLSGLSYTIYRESKQDWNSAAVRGACGTSLDLQRAPLKLWSASVSMC